MIFYRRELLKSVKNFVYIGRVPVLRRAVLTYILVKAVLVYSKPHAGFAKPFLGIGSPIAIALLMIILGIVLMMIQRITMPEFFRRKPEVGRSPVLVNAPKGTGHEPRDRRRLRRVAMLQGGDARRGRGG